MSRYSETSEIIKKTTYHLMNICENQGETSEEEILSGMYNILTEIALSLAVLADTRLDS